MSNYRLLGISGALRAASTNTKLLHEAARVFDPASFEMADICFPLYDGDIESDAGIPDAVKKVANQIAAADAVLISGPEYNKGISGVLKNALDWISRTSDNPWDGKPVAIMSAAAGRAGGPRTQAMLRACLMAFRPRVLQGPEVLIGASGQAFDENGHLKDQFSIDLLTQLMDGLRAEIDLVSKK